MNEFTVSKILVIVGILLCLETIVSGHNSHYEAQKLQNYHGHQKQHHHGHHKQHHHHGHHKNHHAHKHYPQLPGEDLPHKYHHHKHHKPHKVYYYDEPEMKPTPFCPEPFGNFPIPDSGCTGFYYMCKSYVHIAKKCPGKLVFDPESKSCHYGTCLDLSNKH